MNQQETKEVEQAETPIAAKTPRKLILDQKTIWILAIASALSVANLYYNQPLLAEMARSFSVSEGTIGFVATLGQLGYAAGMLFIVPLGDSLDRRNLIIMTLAVVTLSLIGVAIAPSLVFLGLASFAVGATTVAPQVIVPFAASLAEPSKRGRVVGMVMGGLLIGILLARTVSGYIGAQLGWRGMYWIAAVLMVVLAVVLRLLLPKEEPRTSLSYGSLLRSLWGLFCSEPVVREAGIFGGLVFGAFSVFWVTLVFFLGTPPYHYGSEVAGLFGLVGVVGALAASNVGKLSDRIDARIITGVMISSSLAAFIIFWLFGYMLWGLIVGVILLDLGTQGAHISNQTRVFALNAEARSRLNTIYIVSYFIGGSLGSTLGAYAWSIAHWNGVCFVGVAMLVVALIVYVTNFSRFKRVAIGSAN